MMRRGIYHISRITKHPTRYASIPKPLNKFQRTIRSEQTLYQIPTRYFHSSTSAWNVIREPLESLGDSITSAVLLSWSKKAGDAVKEDDVICIVETDKVTMDIRAKRSGVFVEGFPATGAEINVGNELYAIDTAAVASTPTATTTASTPITSSSTSTSTSPSSDATTASTSTPPVKVTVPVPIMGESITQGVLAKWSVKKGDFVLTDAVVASIETDKVTVEVRSPQDGIIDELFANESAEVNVGNPLFVLLTGPSVKGTVSTTTAAPAVKVAEPVKATTPAVAPVQAAIPKAPAAPTTPTSTPKPAASSSTPASPSSTIDRTETRVKLTRMRLRIAQRLKEAQNTAAMLTTFQEVDMTNLMAMRNKYKEDFEKVHGVKLGFMSAFVKACTSTLLEIPAVNGVIDDNTNEIVYRNYIDISVAVASPTGLVVPVLRNTHLMNFADVEKAIGEYGQKAKKGTLALEDMAGGTFTITNGGVFGSLFSTPMINPPQSAILGMHATKMRAVVVDGKVEARPMMYLALTYDHRLVDGREAVVFLKSVAQKIEDPTKMLLSI